MFVGHAMLAFALVGLGAVRLGWSREAALRLAVVAALFATLPDVDIVYAPVGLLGGVSGVAGAVHTFWVTGNVVHRGPTHSLVLGVMTAVAAGAAARRTASGRVVAAVLLVAVVGTALAVSGILGGVVVGVFVLGAVALVAVARRFSLPAGATAIAAAAGLLSHPFGDLFTGSPPAMLYPFDATLFTARVHLLADPTLNLLGAFAVELATIWLAFAVYCRLTRRRPLALIDRRAVAGAAYPLAALWLPAPTIDAASPFVFSVLAVGFVGVTPPRIERVLTLRAVGTALAAVTVAWLAYLLVYLVG
ncbi:MAG: metal-dependent hydrolase [Haloarculaceae archaeon]